MLEPTVVGQHRAGGDIQKVNVPDIHQAENHRQVVGQRRLAEMRVHFPGAFQQLVEALHAHGQRNRQTDRRPQRKAAAHPFPEQQLVAGVDAPLAHFPRVGGHAHEMTAHQRPLLVGEGPLQPGTGGFRVGQGVQGGEGFRRHHHQCGGRVEVTEQRRDLAAVHGRHEMERGPAAVLRAEIPQRVGRHQRSQVRAAHAHVDHIGDRVAVAAAPLAAQNLVDDLAHARQLVVHLRGGGGLFAQAPVQRRARFGPVHVAALEQGADPALQVAGPGQFPQQIQGLGGQALLAVVHQQAAAFPAERLETPGVVGEQVRQMPVARLAGVVRQGLAHRPLRGAEVVGQHPVFPLRLAWWRVSPGRCRDTTNPGRARSRGRKCYAHPGSVACPCCRANATSPGSNTASIR